MASSIVKRYAKAILEIASETKKMDAWGKDFKNAEEIILDEDLKNYQEIYNWMTALGFPREYGQFASLKESSLDAGEYDSMFSDMTIMLLTNKSNPNYEISFTDAFPTSLSGVQLDVTQQALDPIVVDVTFNFKGMFNIKKVN